MISAVCLIACGVARAGVRTSHCDGPTTYRRPHGITYFHGCYSVGDDQLWGVVRRRKGTDHTWAALRSIRAARPDGAPIYVILDNLSAHLNWRIRRWAARKRDRSLLRPDLRVLGQPN